MRHIEFLSTEQVIDLHDAALAEHGGIAGIRDLSLLESAVAMPRQAFGGELLHPELQDMAAAYLFHLCQNHAFIDGNKRVAIASCEAFLNVNGQELGGSDGDWTNLTFAVARGEMNKPVIAAWIKNHMVKLAEE